MPNFPAFLVLGLVVRVEAVGLVGGVAIDLSRSDAVFFLNRPREDLKV